MNKSSIGAIVKINNRLAVVLGDSKTLHLDGLREKGCIGTDKFKYLNVTSEDPKIKNENVLIFRREYSMYHNYVSSNEDLLVYKYLDDDEGAKCIKLSTFLSNVDNPGDNDYLSSSAKVLDDTLINPVLSEDL